MSDHDGAYHRLFSQPQLVVELLRDVIRPRWLDDVDLSTPERVNLKLHGEGPRAHGTRRRDGDVLWRLRHRDGTDVYLYLILEFQSTVDRWMAVRLLVYVGLLYQHLIQEERLCGGLLPPVFPVVLYNGSSPWTAAASLRPLIALPADSALDDAQPTIRYHVLDEVRFPRQELEHRHSALATVLLLEHCQSRAEALEQLTRLVRLLEGAAYREVRRGIADFLNASSVAHLLPDTDFRQTLEGGNPMLAERIAQWNEELRQEHRAEFRQEALIDSLRLVLQARFGELPPGLEGALAALTDDEALRRLTRLAATSPSLATFEATLREPGAG